MYKNRRTEKICLKKKKVENFYLKKNHTLCKPTEKHCAQSRHEPWCLKAVSRGAGDKVGQILAPLRATSASLSLAVCFPTITSWRGPADDGETLHFLHAAALWIWKSGSTYYTPWYCQTYWTVNTFHFAPSTTTTTLYPHYSASRFHFCRRHPVRTASFPI